jgi:hypothetical protein
MGVWASSFWGGAQYSLPEQANLTLIFFFTKVTKKFFPDIPKKIFTDICTDILQIFAIKDTNIFFTAQFFRNLYVLPEFRSDFCPKNFLPPGPYAHAR